MLNEQPYSPAFFNPEQTPTTTPVDNEFNNYYAIMGSILGVGAPLAIIIAIVFFRMCFKHQFQDKALRAAAPNI